MKITTNTPFIISLFMCLIPLYSIAQTDDDIDVLDEPEELVQTNTSVGLNRYTLGNGITFVSKTDSYRLNMSGYVQLSGIGTMYSGDDELYTRFRVRRARIRMNGRAFNDKIRYRLGLDMVKGSETDGDGSMLSDAWIQYRPWGNGKLAITMGQRATPTDNRELLTSTYTLQLVERSKLSSVFGTIREVGVFAEGSYKIGTKSYLRPSLAITDGSGSITLNKRYGGFKYGARINYLPFGLFRMAGEGREGDMVYELSPKLVIGAAYSYSDGTSDRRGGRDNGSILYMNDKNRIDLPDMAKFTADFMFKYHGWSLMGEYVKTWGYVSSSITKRVRNDGSTTTDFKIDGVQNVRDYILNRMMIGSGFNIQGGYMFRSLWSIDGRYTHLMPDQYSYMNNDLYFNRNNIYDIGVTKYLTKSYAAKIQATVSFAKADGTARKFNGETFTGWEKNFMLLFQLAF